MVCKKYSRKFPNRSGGEPMTCNVETAQDIAKRLINAEANGPGDFENAMRRLEARRGIPFSLLYSLKYRPPKDILLSQWNLLLDVYEMECARQERRYQLQRETAKALKNATSKALTGAAAAVARVGVEEA